MIQKGGEDGEEGEEGEEDPFRIQFQTLSEDNDIWDFGGRFDSRSRRQRASGTALRYASGDCPLFFTFINGLSDYRTKSRRVLKRSR